MWNGQQRKVVRLGILLWPSSLQNIYQEQWQGRRLLSPLSLRWSHRLSQLTRIPMNPQSLMGLAVNIQSCHPASLISTAAHLIVCVGYYVRDPRRRWVQPPITGALNPVFNFDAPKECEYHWRLGDNAHNHRWQCNLHWWWAQMSLLGYFFEQHFWLQLAKKCIYRFEPFLHTAGSTLTKKETEHGDVFSQNERSVAAHLGGMRSSPTSQNNSLTLRKNSNITHC